jgi:transcriptional repressor NrdR
MKCPYCSSEDSQVKDSRPAEDGSSIRRRRECPACDARFTTFERVQLRELTVVKSDGRREPFDREKLLRSLRLPLQKRPVGAETMQQTVSDIVRSLEKDEGADVTTREIGARVMQALSALDPVAYVRYASVYKDFRVVEDYKSFVADLEKVYKKAGQG